MQNTWLRNVRNKYRYSIILLKELVRTDFKMRYQNSVLGYLWSLLKPLFMFLVLYVIFVRFLKIGSNVENWPVALFLGLVYWEFFSEVTKQGLKAIVSKGGIIRKINFPKYIIVVASSLSAFINLLLNLVVVAVFVLLSDATITWSYLLIPLYIFQLYVFALGLAFVLSTLYVKARDINFIWEIILRAGFYASAVMFPMTRILDASEGAGRVLLMNPMAQTIQDSRHAMLSHIPSSRELLGSTLLSFVPLTLSLLVLLFGAWYFRTRSKHFAEEV